MPNNVKTVPLTPTPDGDWHAVPPVPLPPRTGEWLISFQLKGDHAEKVTFASKQPIWVQETTKPTKFAEHPQIPAHHVSQDGKELIILDLNSNAETTPPLKLFYRLNFDGYADLDPIIENGGGPKPLLETEPGTTGAAREPGVAGISWGAETIALAIVAAIVLLVIGGVIGRATARSPST